MLENPMFENLESRLLLSAISKGTLKITGTKRADTVIISTKKSTLTVSFNGKVQKFKTSEVKAIRADLKAGNDYFYAKGKLPAFTIIGGTGDDSLAGASKNDTIYGGAGDDLIYSVAGNDVLFGDAGSDQIYGGDGDDSIDGGLGKDYVFAEMGNDTVHGGEGDDVLSLGPECLAGTIHEAHTCTPIPQSSDTDQGYGDAGNDFINAGKGGDSVFGGDGNDSFQIYNFAPARAGSVDGGAGQDTLGKTGTDSIYTSIEVFE